MSLYDADFPYDSATQRCLTRDPISGVILYKLEIPPEWRSFSHGADRLDLSEEKSDPFREDLFMSKKPDIDVLGPFRRARRGRGWYQVMHPSPHGEPAASSLVGPPRTASRAPTTAASIPVEIFNQLPTYIIRDYRDKVTVHWLLERVHKPSLGAIVALALVCREWRTPFQILALSNLPRALSSREDLFAFLQLSQATTSFLSSLVETLKVSPFPGPSVLNESVSTDIVAKGPPDPWIHTLPVSLSQNAEKRPNEHLSKDVFMSLQEDCLPAFAKRTMRSIHVGIPRTHPNFSIGITFLNLTSLAFKRLDNLLHLVWEIPMLVSFNGDRLTWPIASPLSVSTLWSRSYHTGPSNASWTATVHRFPSSVTLEDCTQAWPACLLYKSMVRTSFGVPGVPSDDLQRRSFVREQQVIGTLLESLESTMSNQVFWCTPSCVSSSAKSFHQKLLFVREPPSHTYLIAARSIVLDIYTRDPFALNADISSQCPADVTLGIPYEPVVAVSLALKDDFAEKLENFINWGMLFETMLLLPHIKAVRIMFKVQSFAEKFIKRRKASQESGGDFQELYHRNCTLEVLGPEPGTETKPRPEPNWVEFGGRVPVPRWDYLCSPPRLCQEWLDIG